MFRENEPLIRKLKMPPKRKLKQSPPEESSDSGSDTSAERSESPPLPVYRNAQVGIHVDFFSGLPTESVLAQVVGVAARLSARSTALAHTSVSGEARVYRDCIRVTRSALSFLSPAVCDLAGLEIVLLASLEDLTSRLEELTTPARRRSRHR